MKHEVLLLGDSIRMFYQEAVREALGRVCASPTVACPPAIPIAMAGERIGPEAVSLFERCGVGFVEVVR